MYDDGLGEGAWLTRGRSNTYASPTRSSTSQRSRSSRRAGSAAGGEASTGGAATGDEGGGRGGARAPRPPPPAPPPPRVRRVLCARDTAGLPRVGGRHHYGGSWCWDGVMSIYLSLAQATGVTLRSSLGTTPPPPAAEAASRLNGDRVPEDDGRKLYPWSLAAMCGSVSSELPLR